MPDRPSPDLSAIGQFRVSGTICDINHPAVSGDSRRTK